MATISDGMLLTTLRACGGQLISVGAGSFWAIFDDEYLEVLGNEVDGAVETTGPALSACRSSDIAALSIVKGTQLTIGAEQFKVRRLEPDGTGVTLVRLTRV